jgi:hypothetical protein
MINPSSNQFDFKDVRLFARRYLETYYIGVNEDETPIARFLIEKFRKLPQKKEALEIGCGPTIHHALAVAPYLAAIDMADYLPDNLTEIQKWQSQQSDAFSWRPYTEMILQEEGIPLTENSITDRENLLRKAIRNLRTCDVTKSPPLDAAPYPIVLTFYCAEEVGTTPGAWEEVMRNISALVAPGGHLFLSALRGASRYILGDPAGAHEWLPCASVTEELLQQCLKRLGYKPSTIDIRSIDTPSLADLGIPGILVAAAEKSA